MKKIILAFLFILVNDAAYSQSSALADATVTIVPAVGTAKISGEALMQAVDETSQAVQTMILSSTPIWDTESTRFRVVSNAAVYSVGVLPLPVLQNFVQLKNSSRELAISIKTASPVLLCDVYSISMKDVFNPLLLTASTPVAPEIVVHFN